MGRVFTQETMEITGLQKPELILVIAQLVRSGVAKNIKDAIHRLDAGEFNGNELKEAIIRAHQAKIASADSEEETKVNVR
jgi:hypothetical protein